MIYFKIMYYPIKRKLDKWWVELTDLNLSTIHLRTVYQQEDQESSRILSILPQYMQASLGNCLILEESRSMKNFSQDSCSESILG
jgi:hypothetical protein